MLLKDKFYSNAQELISIQGHISRTGLRGIFICKDLSHLTVDLILDLLLVFMPSKIPCTFGFGKKSWRNALKDVCVWRYKCFEFGRKAWRIAFNDQSTCVQR